MKQTTSTTYPKFSDPLVIVPEEHNIALKLKINLLNNDHSTLVKRYKANLSLPSSPIIPENYCSKKLLQIMTKDDKILWDLVPTFKTGYPLEIHGSYMKNYKRELQIRDELFFMDNKIVVPAGAPSAFRTMSHNFHPGQFGMKFLAEFIWWLNIYRELYHHGKSSKQCSEAGQNLRFCWDRIFWVTYRTCLSLTKR